jgi:hypothetical protein
VEEPGNQRRGLGWRDRVGADLGAGPVANASPAVQREDGRNGTNISIPAPPRAKIPLYPKLSTIGFGGPAALVGYMRKDLVDEGKYLDEYL